MRDAALETRVDVIGSRHGFRYLLSFSRSVGSELGEGTRRFVSLQFMEIDEATRSALVAWVNREQVRRRIELRGRSLSRSRG